MSKKEDQKHKGEHTIGKIIYGFMLFAPLFAIATACLSVVFNKTEAIKEEATINYKYETNEVNSAEDLKVGNIYIFDLSNFLDNMPNNDSASKVEYSNIFNDNFSFNLSGGITFRKNSQNRILCTITGTNYMPINALKNILINDFYTGEPLTTYIILYETFQNPEFVENDITAYYSKSDYLPIESVEITQTGTDNENVFYRATQKVEESTLFNWAKTSGIYTAVYATTQALNINNTFLPMLMTYWLIMSVLYFLYDIILMMLNVLHHKIHELQDSI